MLIVGCLSLFPFTYSRREKILVWIVKRILFAMAVKINHILYLLDLWKIDYKLLYFHRFRCQLLYKWAKYLENVLSPMSVEVKSSHIGPWHPMNHTVRIHHWNYENVEMINHIASDWILALRNKFHHLLCHERTNGLARMLSP